MNARIAEFAAALAPYTAIAIFLGAVAALVVYLWKFGKKITASMAAARSAEHAAKGAAQDAQSASENSAASHDATVTAAGALDAAVAALNTMRDRHDDLMAAYFRQETMEGRLRVLERWAAEHEDTLYQPTRAISTTGAPHAEQ